MIPTYKYFTVAVVAVLVAAAQCDFLPERLHVIDKNEGSKNYLVRGNLPINAKREFQIKELKGNLSELTGLKNYQLVVYSLMNFLTPKETRNRYIEEKFFEKHPEAGEYRNKVVLGSLIDPNTMSKWAIDTFLAVSSIVDFDDIDNFVTELHDEIHGKQQKRIIYIHCSAGVDRTGYVSAAYKLKFMNYTLKKAMGENIHILKGLRKHMHFNTENGLKWYCHSLDRSKEDCYIPN